MAKTYEKTKITDFDTVLNQYGALLSRVASTYEADPDLQEELLQEICVAVWQALSRFNNQSQLKTYVLRIAHNRAVSHVAKEVKTIKSDGSSEENLATLESAGRTIEEQMQSNRKVERLINAVRQLKLPARQVLTMSMEGLSYQEISEITGQSVNNVGVILNRAKTTVLKEVGND